MQQHSLDWYRARLGRVTGSQVGLLMKKGKKKDEPFSETAYTYIHQIAAERALNPELVGDDDMFAFYVEQTSATSKDMRFGTEQEPHARAMYSEVKNVEVYEVGACQHPTIQTFSSSPDGITEDNGIRGCIEIKCPKAATFSKYVANITDNASLKSVNPDYFYQCQAHMACVNAQYCDFVIYCPYLSHPIHIIRITRDDNEIAEMESRVMLAEQIIQNFQTNLNRA